MARLNLDGTPDLSFNGADPYIQVPLLDRDAPATTLVGTRSDAGWFTLQPDGKVLLGGFFYGGETDPSTTDTHGTGGVNIELIRFNVDGTLDTTFGDRGEAITRNGDLIRTMMDGLERNRLPRWG